MGPNAPCLPHCIGRLPHCSGKLPHCSGSLPHCSSRLPHFNGRLPHCSGRRPHCKAMAGHRVCGCAHLELSLQTSDRPLKCIDTSFRSLGFPDEAFFPRCFPHVSKRVVLVLLVYCTRLVYRGNTAWKQAGIIPAPPPLSLVYRLD